MVSASSATLPDSATTTSWISAVAMRPRRTTSAPRDHDRWRRSRHPPGHGCAHDHWHVGAPARRERARGAAYALILRRRCPTRLIRRHRRTNSAPGGEAASLLVQDREEGLAAGRQRAALGVDDVKMPADAQSAYRDDRELPRPHLTAHGVARDERYPETGHHALLDRLGVVELHRGARRDARLLQRALHHLASGRARFAHEQALADQLGPADGAAPRPAVLTGRDEHELVGEPGRHAAFAGAEDVAAHHAEVHVAVPDALFDDTGIGHVEPEVDARIPPLEGGDDAREHVDPRRGAGPDHQ